MLTAYRLGLNLYFPPPVYERMFKNEQDESAKAGRYRHVFDARRGLIIIRSQKNVE